MPKKTRQDTLVDVVDSSVVPYVIHFGTKGIAPKVVRVTSENLLTVERAPGIRLGQLLKESHDDDMLERVVGETGKHAGYISKYCISHGDLYADNVFVQKHPVIIDWDRAQIMQFGSNDPASASGRWLRINGRMFLEDMKTTMEEVGRDKYVKRFSEAYLRAFLKEFLRPLDTTHEEIQRRAQALMYGRKV